MVCWHSESFPLLLLIMLTNHKGLSQQLKCSYLTRPNTIIDVKTALAKGMKSLAPFYKDTKEECLNECCSDLPIKGGYPCNFMTFAPTKTYSPNCYLFYCSDKDACPMIHLNGYISYVIENDQVNVKAVDMSVRKLHSQSGEKSSDNGIPTDIETLAPGLSSSRITINFLPPTTIHSRTKQPMAGTTFKVPTVLLTTSTQTTSSTPVTTTQLPVTTSFSVTTKKSTATTTLLNSLLLTSAKSLPTTVFPIMLSTPTRTAAVPTTLLVTPTMTQAITSITTKPLTTSTLQTTLQTTTTLPTTLQTTTTQPTMTTTLPTTLQTTTTQPMTTTLPTTLQTTTTQSTMTTTLPTTLQTTTTQPMTTTLPTTLQTTTTQSTMTTTLPTTLQTTTTQSTMTTTLPTTLQTTTTQSTMTTTLPTTLQTTTTQPTTITTLLTHPQTSTTTWPTTTTTLPTTTTGQTTPLPKTQPMTTIFLPTTDLTTTTITTVSTRKLIPNVTQQSTVSRIPVAKTPFFRIITVESNNGNSNKKDDGEKDQRHNLGGPNESAGKMEDSRMETKGGLIAALLFGLLFLTIVVIVLSKQVIESFNRRHYTKMDFLMDGMYVDA
ncbi:MANSC domain-containing protein 1 [Pristis pectinata]|uniref:MANSC domain-containing protein 1 n=1 Tax=Pristis pectinata TaxID=685728 RepID=UPI00223CCD5D|nr:MANSC domain-containing protein 1 [Pristis pectinata]XP_051886382.1 MANSC domain-containing protein 1 [Pristis pectinata]XP_051886383.1 MANSC domain-containing protein 1 [Pristis pectinata]